MRRKEAEARREKERIRIWLVTLLQARQNTCQLHPPHPLVTSDMTSAGTPSTPANGATSSAKKKKLFMSSELETENHHGKVLAC